MTNNLRAYFPIIRERKEVRAEISARKDLETLFQSWTKVQQEEFLDFCTGVKGVKLLYDSFFKEVMNPENVPERMNEFLSLLLGTQVKILYVLPNDSTRIADESSLLIMDIVVQLADGSIVNVEVQKISYKCNAAHVTLPIFYFANTNELEEKAIKISTTKILKTSILSYFLKKVLKNSTNSPTPTCIILNNAPTPALSWILYKNIFLFLLTFSIKTSTISL